MSICPIPGLAELFENPLKKISFPRSKEKKVYFYLHRFLKDNQSESKKQVDDFVSNPVENVSQQHKKRKKGKKKKKSKISLTVEKSGKNTKSDYLDKHSYSTANQCSILPEKKTNSSHQWSFFSKSKDNYSRNFQTEPHNTNKGNDFVENNEFDLVGSLLGDCNSKSSHWSFPSKSSEGRSQMEIGKVIFHEGNDSSAENKNENRKEEIITPQQDNYNTATYKNPKYHGSKLSSFNIQETISWVDKQSAEKDKELSQIMEISVNDTDTVVDIHLKTCEDKDSTKSVNDSHCNTEKGVECQTVTDIDNGRSNYKKSEEYFKESPLQHEKSGNYATANNPSAINKIEKHAEHASCEEIMNRNEEKTIFERPCKYSLRRKKKVTYASSARQERIQQYGDFNRSSTNLSEDGPRLLDLVEGAPIESEFEQNSKGKRKRVASTTNRGNRKKSKKQCESSRAYWEKRSLEIEREKQKREYDANLPCVFYKKTGECRYGDNCRYSHDIEVDRKMMCCKYYVAGACLNGDDCRYFHSEWPCKFFHITKSCNSGDNCKFSHAEMTSEMKELFDARQSYEESLRINENSDNVLLANVDKDSGATGNIENDAIHREEMESEKDGNAESAQEGLKKDGDFKFPSLYYELT